MAVARAYGGTGNSFDPESVGTPRTPLPSELASKDSQHWKVIWLPDGAPRFRTLAVATDGPECLLATLLGIIWRQ